MDELFIMIGFSQRDDTEQVNKSEQSPSLPAAPSLLHFQFRCSRVEPWRRLSVERSQSRIDGNTHKKGIDYIYRGREKEKKISQQVSRGGPERGFVVSLSALCSSAALNQKYCLMYVCLPLGARAVGLEKSQAYKYPGSHTHTHTHQHR